MNRKTQIKILSFLITASFFLPIFTWHGFEMSGLNFVLSSQTGSYKYLLLLIPVPGFLLFIDMRNEHSLIFNLKTLSCLPCVGFVLTSILVYAYEKAEFAFYGEKSFFSIIDIGFWPILIFSLLLIFLAFEKKPEHQYV